ncbi:BT1A1 protein, partial [Nycticryphes semicollaris]|nr:BT1A1 protein [Nycticryphes semicollaris]
VTLDPDTAHSNLVLGEDLRSVRCGPTQLNLPKSTKRFTLQYCVLGKKSFREGRHCWEVEVEGEVEGDSWWAIGVAKESVKRKRRVVLSPEEGVWAIRHQKGKFESLTSDPTPLSLSLLSRRILVCLDCTEGLVTF